MRVAINLLTENPDAPSGAHWYWTRVVPEMAKRLGFDEELHLLVSPKSRHLYAGCGCPVVTSDTSSMPEVAGGAAILSDSKDPASIARAIVEAIGPGSKDRLRDAGIRRAGEFTWGAMAEATLDVYRGVADRRRHIRA